jgi:hypothetical protein
MNVVSLVNSKDMMVCASSTATAHFIPCDLSQSSRGLVATILQKPGTGRTYRAPSTVPSIKPTVVKRDNAVTVDVIRPMFVLPVDLVTKATPF